MDSEVDVAIVGAGAAGIGAARRLADQGRSVLLIDALPRLGGRAWTVDLEGMPCDMGCGWLHSAERNPWVMVAEGLGGAIDRSPSAWRAQYRNLGFSAGEQQAAQAAFEAFSEGLRIDPPTSDRASDALDAGDPWRGYIEALSSYINGAQLDELSIADYLAYDDAASERNWRLPQGYGALIAGQAARLPQALGTCVTAIAHDGRGVRLTTDRGDIRARAAIVTASSDVLASGAIRLPGVFDPALHAAAHLPLGLADKLFLALPDPEAISPEQHLLGNPHRAATGSYYLRPFGRPMIELFLGGGAARMLEAEGEGAALRFAREELGALFGSDFARGLRPLAASAWAKVPSIRGSYSHALPGHADARAILNAPVDDRILLSGEACSAQDFSTAHGAYATGIAAAERISALLK
ncbi:monoamine oxidase [Sphingomonas vulcanisoli]|uniref:Tryptophan 2-monooxygenase n=1 Tax=Sphingomonas vulcanisoli TaxID=1658060 RepID=A0ABX0TSN7_9SPHN|nr:NAD(P)/FAD-dependent oxidoreductase [Sphingomonas vulcanisoli]NIJ07535.1 monoamine oxidase [Sphingomonas vulcanisoli]